MVHDDGKPPLRILLEPLRVRRRIETAIHQAGAKLESPLRPWRHVGTSGPNIVATPGPAQYRARCGSVPRYVRGGRSTQRLLVRRGLSGRQGASRKCLGNAKEIGIVQRWCRDPPPGRPGTCIAIYVEIIEQGLDRSDAMQNHLGEGSIGPASRLTLCRAGQVGEPTRPAHNQLPPVTPGLAERLGRHTRRL